MQWRLKRLNYLRQRLLGSVALRGWQGTFTRILEEFRHRPVLDPALTLLPLEEAFVPFTVPSFGGSTPRVSIIVPVYSKLFYTVACLQSLALHRPEASFEVIVVDDASPDDSALALSRIAGIRLIRNERNLGFIGSCNAGAAAARGQYLYFLNNDAQLMQGSLDYALACFDEEADCGLVGSRLVYPDGRLQEAGGLVFSDGACWNIGRFESRDNPAFRYRRRVDYVMGASMLIPAAVFQQIGGFDTRYAPAYYEDVDLAFEVRKLGLNVVYEPRSVVIHFEGISAGTDLDAGMKRHQRINQAVFAEKWQEELKTHPAPGTALKKALQRPGQKHILVVDSMTPDARRDSGSLRMLEILATLHAEGHRLSFRPDDGRCENDDLDRLGALGVEMLCPPWTRDVPGWLRENGDDLATVVLSRHAVAGQYLALVRKHAPQAQLIFDTVDLHFLRENRAAELTGIPAMQRHADASRRSELHLIEQSDVTWVVSEYEQYLLKQMLPEAQIELVSNIHEVHGRRAPYEMRRDLVFIGGHGHPPNADAMRWIAEEILPAVQKVIPNIRIHILGDLPDATRSTLERPGLELHGRVPELAPWLDQCLASIAPLRFGAGVKGKINTAMSYGLPVIATTIAIEGMHLHDDHDVLLADLPEQFANAVKRLYDDQHLWYTISNSSLQNVAAHFSRDAARAAIRRTLSQVRYP